MMISLPRPAQGVRWPWMPWMWMASPNPSSRPPPGTPVPPLLTNDPDCKNSLLFVIERQIIPRLIQSHPRSLTPDSGAVVRVSDADLQNFARACLMPEGTPQQDLLSPFKQQGLGTDALFLQVIAPAARWMGEQWERDQLDFSQVTLGLLRLHQLSHELGYAYRDGPQQAGRQHRIMLACAPGSQHFLGLTIVSEFFRKDRWQVVFEISATPQDLNQALSNEWFDLVGLSVGLAEQIDTLPALIQGLRQHSRNPALRVLLGGPAFLHQAVQAPALGADRICMDAADAVQCAAQFMTQDRGA